ncbi:putative baseplate assembly protein [Streptomyces sp. Tu102]|uniref:putative baseplate assembly protein n=1 Tax=Streptomyces sp. Tu102 TaxID=2838019 RepID=UPI001BDCD662|nr:putative baseplate assembly protein [Streptomyces sp. Tu102]MBT1090321.1 putative baseplate assembly protein [Streptomyces sp. Tu102]
MNADRPDLSDEDFLRRLETLRPGFVPEWPAPDGPGADAALLRVAARFLSTVAQRLAQAPDKNRAAYYAMLGVRQTPPQPARVPVVFRLTKGAADVALPAGTRLAAPPPPGSNDQVVFETEQAAGLAAANLREIVSLWPGRDQYADHSRDHELGLPFRPFDRAALRPVPHELYLGHESLLDLAGRSSTAVSFELTTEGSERLDVVWEYWDGSGWRGFVADDPADGPSDGTDGLRRSGAYRLRTDFAKTARTSVDGVEAYWIRGRLAESEALPPDPSQVLPEVDAIRLNTRMSRGYAAVWQVSEGEAVVQPGNMAVLVRDSAGVPLANVGVRNAGGGQKRRTNNAGRADVKAAAGDVIVVALGSFEQQQPVPAAVSALVFTLDLLPADRAFAAGAEVDLTGPFLPFGPQPQPGAAFHFACDEALGKPGARLRVYVRPAASGNGNAGRGGSRLRHMVSWEYFNGRQWTSLRTDTSESAGDLTDHGFVDFPPVPADMTDVEVGGVTARWMRARLVSGGYGVTRTLSVGTPATQLPLFESRPPLLADFRLGYTWQQGPIPPQHVRTYNDFGFTDRTREATWPGRVFQPYVPVGDALPALYFGFDGPLPVASLGIFLDVSEQRGGTEPGGLVWEYWNGSGWAPLTVTDGTRGLRVPGVLTLIGPGDSAELARFGGPRHWLRARLAQDGAPALPPVDTVRPNAVWAVQRQTVRAEPLGTSTGFPGQVLAFRMAPLLPDVRIEVRELAGPQAAVEWRIVAAELFGGNEQAVRELERALAADSVPDEVRRGPLRLRRDRRKRVTEVWVRWQERDRLDASGPADRHLTVDPLRGLALFGDGVHGRVPSAGAAVLAELYRTGGGSAGNVAADTLTQVLGAAAGIDAVTNPVPAEGGADGEMYEQVLRRAPGTVRARGRAVTAGDYEALARAASPSVARVRAYPGLDGEGRPTPGHVTLVVVPYSGQPRPMPSAGLRESVRRAVAALAPAALTDGISVVGPAYAEVGVEATLVPRDPAEAGAVQQAVRRAVEAFFDPVSGGPAGEGLEPGGAVYASDLAAVVERVEGVEQVRDLTFVRDDVFQGDTARVPAGRLAAAGPVRLRLTGGE